MRHLWTLQLAAVVLAAQRVVSLELSARQLSNITTAGSGPSASFAFYSDGSLVTELSALDLAKESTILLQNNSLTSVPAALFQVANNSTYIDISNNPLTQLEAESFVNMPYLTRVVCTNTQIQELPTGLASNCPLLSVMAFNQSTIRTVESQALVNLPKLQSIDLAQNNVSLIYGDSFVNLTALHTLDLSYNELEVVPNGLLTASASWKALDFSHNGILRVPSGIRKAIVEGYISFDYNSFVEIDEGAFADASEIRELRLASNAIFTLNSRAFSGMEALRKLNLSDNVISVIDEDAFKDVNGLEDLRLDYNNIHRLTLSSVPANLERLELQYNLLDLMPDFPDDFVASRMIYLNMSRNFLWSIATNDALTPYTGLETLDLSNNRIVNFSSAVFDPIMSTIESMNFDSNLITSIPSTNFVYLVKKLLTNVTLLDNPGIGWSSNVDMRNDCPNGSVFEELDLSSSSVSGSTTTFLPVHIQRKTVPRSKRTRKMDIKEQEAMNDWRMGLMMHQLAEPMSPSDSLLDDEVDEEASEHGEIPFRIYDLPEETKDLVLSTLRDYFQIRKEKRWRALPPNEQEEVREWNDVEWETFHMHRILSRSYHGEIFLGDYCGTQVVVKRMMTLRFEVKELADTIKDVELLGIRERW
uniref:Uncharacterized protein n=1 Tax=Phytophthora ramorum TaxID=164328 RepID=H3HBK5_PHYRM